MYDIKLKTTNEKTEKQTNKNSQTQTTVWWLPEGGAWRVVKAKGGQIHDDGRGCDCRWWAHSATHRSCVIECTLETFM